MAKLADLRSNLSKEEREEYEKYRKADKIQDDDIKVLDDVSETKKGTVQIMFFCDLFSTLIYYFKSFRKTNTTPQITVGSQTGCGQYIL